MKIYKYNFVPMGIPNLVDIPKGGKILTLQAQYSLITMWVLVDNKNPFETRKFKVYGTGHEIPDNPGEYIGTVQIEELVWHVFEITGS